MLGVVAVGSVPLSFAVLGGSEFPPIAPAGLLRIARMGRIVSFFTLLAFFAALRQRPNVHGRWWQFLIVQGVTDAAGHYCLFVGSRSDNVAAAVATSALGAVTALLAWPVPQGAMGRVQWMGVVLVFAGIGVLAASG